MDTFITKYDNTIIVAIRVKRFSHFFIFLYLLLHFSYSFRPPNKKGEDMTETNQTDAKPLFIRRNQIKQITGLSPSTIWRLEAEGAFPKRRKVGHCVGWLYSEVENFLQQSEAV